MPEITYPANLPITDRHEDLLAAIGDHQVVIVAGETGSGKSTQLPKLCLELGRGVTAMIGHTQPRRVAARAIAERVAAELGGELGSTSLGDTIGYAVRFTDRVSDTTLVKVMTDGILLAEIRRDRELRRYDTLIIDEAHERSLNIDFLLGYLHQLLPRRPDLKVIITSATIDTARFAEHFGGAPVIEVTGRAYPVEVRYRPFGAANVTADAPGRGDDRDQVQAICDAVVELEAHPRGDVLVFLSGEREIHDTADALRRLDLRDTEVLALYARLSAAEQHRIFEPHAKRRIVLSTNVAETSLTVPGIRAVVDAGTARISRYSSRLKVQRLPIEPISQASASQRAGRCGRVAPGVCVRLYSEEDLLARPEFTEPEILRTNLASVILQMTDIGLGDVAAFPFVEPPDGRAVRDGVALLHELGALVADAPVDRRRLTPTGKRMARLPIDPRLARMVVEAERLGCLREVMVIAAALSIQDPRERPAEAQQAADEAHRRFHVDGSDFLGYVRLWDHLRHEQQVRSSNQFRRMCRAEHLNHLRVREWQDLYRQLRQAAGSLGVHATTQASHPDHVHQALLAGLLSHLGMRYGTTRDYRGARGAQFAVVPGSAVGKQRPRWVMAAELVETNRLWGRVAAAVQPEWAERLAGHLVTRSYGEPVWDEWRGAAVTTERVSLYGLPIVAGRTVGYERIDHDVAREMFVRHALVAGEWNTRHAFVAHNRTVVEELAALSGRTRRPSLVDEESLVAFYAHRIGVEVTSGQRFDRWWKRERTGNPELLTMTAESLSEGARNAPSWSDYPGEWRQGELTFALTYRFEPGQPGDGATVHLPLALLNQVTGGGFDWGVPGFREDLVGALLRTLPKAIRRELTPMADVARAAWLRLAFVDEPLTERLAAVLVEVSGQRVSADDFDVERVPAHLRMTFAIEDESGATIASGNDLDTLRARLVDRVRTTIAQSAHGIERGGIVAWDFGELPRRVESPHANGVVVGYPALLDDGGSVSIRVVTNPETQAQAMAGGLRRLLLLTIKVSLRTLDRRLGAPQQLAVAALGTTPARLRDDAIVAAVDHLIAGRTADVWDAVAFDALRDRVAARLAPLASAAIRKAGEIAIAAQRLRARLDRLVAPRLAPSVDDARAQLDRLVPPGFVVTAGLRRLPDVLRYVEGIDRRLDKLTSDPARDQRKMLEVLALERGQRELASRSSSAVVEDLRWMVEELRVQQFAQALGTPAPVSVQRVRRALDEVR